MSVDTLFDYLESAEGSEDLDALMAGELSAAEIESLCEIHSLPNADSLRLCRISIRCMPGRERFHRPSDATS